MQQRNGSSTAKAVDYAGILYFFDSNEEPY